MARNGEITGVQVGRLWRFRASIINEWLEHKMASWVHVQTRAQRAKDITRPASSFSGNLSQPPASQFQGELLWL